MSYIPKNLAEKSAIARKYLGGNDQSPSAVPDRVLTPAEAAMKLHKAELSVDHGEFEAEEASRGEGEIREGRGTAGPDGREDLTNGNRT
jgi:hypothetical protein